MENSTEGQRKIPEVYDHQPSSSEGMLSHSTSIHEPDPLVTCAYKTHRHTQTKHKTLQANYQNISKIVIKNKWLFSFNYGET